MDLNVIDLINVQYLYFLEEKRRSELQIKTLDIVKELTKYSSMHLMTLTRNLKDSPNERYTYNMMYCIGEMKHTIKQLSLISKNLYKNILIHRLDTLKDMLIHLNKISKDLYRYNKRTLDLYKFEYRDEVHNNLYEVKKELNYLLKEVNEFGY